MILAITFLLNTPYYFELFTFTGFVCELHRLHSLIELTVILIKLSFLANSKIFAIFLHISGDREGEKHIPYRNPFVNFYGHR